MRIVMNVTTEARDSWRRNLPASVLLLDVAPVVTLVIERQVV